MPTVCYCSVMPALRLHTEITSSALCAPHPWVPRVSPSRSRHPGTPAARRRADPVSAFTRFTGAFHTVSVNLTVTTIHNISYKVAIHNTAPVPPLSRAKAVKRSGHHTES